MTLTSLILAPGCSNSIQKVTNSRSPFVAELINTWQSHVASYTLVREKIWAQDHILLSL